MKSNVSLYTCNTLVWNWFYILRYAENKLGNSLAQLWMDNMCFIDCMDGKKMKKNGYRRQKEKKNLIMFSCVFD